MYCGNPLSTETYSRVRADRAVSIPFHSIFSDTTFPPHVLHSAHLAPPRPITYPLVPLCALSPNSVRYRSCLSRNFDRHSPLLGIQPRNISFVPTFSRSTRLPLIQSRGHNAGRTRLYADLTAAVLAWHTMGNCLSHIESDSDIELDRRGGPAAAIRKPSRAVPSGSGETTPASADERGSARHRDNKSYSGQSKGKGKRTRTSLPVSGSSSGMNSNAQVLRTYATLPSPSTSLSPRVLLTSSQHCMAIFDAYPKAKYHFLVLPRYPFPSPSDPDSGKSIVQLGHLDDLRSLLNKAPRSAREVVIGQMADMAREVEEMIRDEMVKSEGVEWKIDVGFHAIPSLKWVHVPTRTRCPIVHTQSHLCTVLP